MTSYRLFPATDGPANAASFASPFLAGVVFEVTQGNCWFEGYWWWVCPGTPAGSTSPQKFALWCLTGSSTGTVISGSITTSGTLATGWNYVPLPSPVPVSIGTSYVASTGFTGNFPFTASQFGTGNPFASGITNGPLTAFSDGTAGGSSPATAYSMPQGVFGTAGSDPSLNMPAAGSNSANFWIDVQVSNTQPPGYTGSYRLWPSNINADQFTSLDAAVNYTVATEIKITSPCIVNKIWYFSPPGATQLATECGIWDIQSQALVAENSSPSWSGSAGSGWVSCSFSNTSLSNGDYRVAVYNGAVTPVGWSAKRLDYWTTGGPGVNGIITGPLNAPSTLAASPANIYQGSGQEPGQSVFAIGPPNQFPNLYVDALFQNYWVDLEVTSATVVSGVMSRVTVSAPPGTPEVFIPENIFALSEYYVMTSVSSEAIINYDIGTPVSGQIRQTAADRTDFAY